MTLLSFRVGTLLAAGAVGARAFGQDLAPALDPVMLGQGLVLSSMMHAQAERDAARLRKQGRLPAVAQRAAKTRFVPSLARRKDQAAKFMAAAKGLNPSLASSLAPAFRSDPVRYAAPFLAKYGLKTDDVADLTAVYLTGAWYGANGRLGDPSRADVTAVRDQLRRVLQGSSRFARVTNAAKQNVGEGSLYLAFVNEALVSTMKANPKVKDRVMAEIASGAKATFGLDLNRMKLTRSGLVN